MWPGDVYPKIRWVRINPINHSIGTHRCTLVRFLTQVFPPSLLPSIPSSFDPFFLPLSPSLLPLSPSLLPFFLPSTYLPFFPLPDVESNSVLLLAYQKGNTNLCKSIVRAGACMGKTNSAGLSIFNYPVATKQLLFKLLDMLPVEPPWVTGGWDPKVKKVVGRGTNGHDSV